MDRVNGRITEPSVYWYKDTVATPVGDVVWVGRMDSSGWLHRASIQASNELYGTQLRQSPGGRYIVFADRNKAASTPVTIVDLDRMRGLHITAGPEVHDYWWQSDTEIGYLDRAGRHIVRVPE